VGQVARVLECLPSKHQALSSNPAPPKKEKSVIHWTILKQLLVIQDTTMNTPIHRADKILLANIYKELIETNKKNIDGPQKRNKKNLNR
jgi:hypothetical protein